MVAHFPHGEGCGKEERGDCLLACFLSLKSPLLVKPLHVSYFPIIQVWNFYHTLYHEVRVRAHISHATSKDHVFSHGAAGPLFTDVAPNRCGEPGEPPKGNLRPSGRGGAQTSSRLLLCGLYKQKS